MNSTVLLLGAAAAFLFFSQGASAKTPIAPNQAAGGPVFPAANPAASVSIPAGQTVYSSPRGQFWHYVDTNGFDHYVFGLSDVAHITNEASRTMDRRTGALTSSDTAHRPSLENPVAIQINLGLKGLQDLG